ncbi:MAG: hypothetical protein AB7G28_03290 [Pirellulales bacterium]
MPYSLRKLRRILSHYDCWEETARGKGSHTMFKRNINGNIFSYPIPKQKKEDEILDCYVAGVRKKFKLSKKDNVSDKEFFSHE